MPLGHKLLLPTHVPVGHHPLTLHAWAQQYFCVFWHQATVREGKSQLAPDHHPRYHLRHFLLLQGGLFDLSIRSKKLTSFSWFWSISFSLVACVTITKAASAKRTKWKRGIFVEKVFCLNSNISSDLLEPRVSVP